MRLSVSRSVYQSVLGHITYCSCCCRDRSCGVVLQLESVFFSIDSTDILSSFQVVFSFFLPPADDDGQQLVSLGIVLACFAGASSVLYFYFYFYSYFFLAFLLFSLFNLMLKAVKANDVDNSQAPSVQADTRTNALRPRRWI